jgi:hypothetical protein
VGNTLLQDLAASKRINVFVHAAKPELGRFKTTIVSELFWPPFQSDAVELPPQVMPALYVSSSMHMAVPRELHLLQCNGHTVKCQMSPPAVP